MVRAEVIRRRFQKLEKYLRYLEKVRRHDQQKFKTKIELWASAERFLQLAIESINDIASHIIADENLGTINQYRNIPKVF